MRRIIWRLAEILMSAAAVVVIGAVIISAARDESFDPAPMILRRDDGGSRYAGMTKTSGTMTLLVNYESAYTLT